MSGYMSPAEDGAAGAHALRVADDAAGGRMLRFEAFDTEVALHTYPGDVCPRGACPGDEASSASVGARAACDPRQLDDALLACAERCAYFERHLSRTRPDSDIARAHAAAPRPVAVQPETAELVHLAAGYCARSGGRFDVTMGGVTGLWDFKRRRVPSRLELARACAHVGMDHVHVDGWPASAAARPTLAIDDPDCVLDLGGIAKGYIADDLARLCRRHGVSRFALNLGGNVLVGGGKPETPMRATGASAGVPAPWRIGIVDPHDPRRTCAVVELVDGTVVTSGLHERRFTRGGRIFHHILDPRDGMPVRTDAASVSIVAARSLDGDGYSTAALMMGAAGALAFVESLPGVEAVVVDSAGAVRWTTGLAGRVSRTSRA